MYFAWSELHISKNSQFDCSTMKLNLLVLLTIFFPTIATEEIEIQCRSHPFIDSYLHITANHEGWVCILDDIGNKPLRGKTIKIPNDGTKFPHHSCSDYPILACKEEFELMQKVKLKPGNFCQKSIFFLDCRVSTKVIVQEYRTPMLANGL